MSEGQLNLKNIIEAALMVAGKPLSLDNLLTLFDENELPTRDELRAAIAELQESCTDRGIELQEVASGYRFQARNDYAPWVARLWEEKPQKYSRALLETLALIAYRQPITRGDIEEIRGVAVSSHIIKTLLERQWIRVVGHREVPGKPAIYATTKQFLDYFNLKSLEQLPTLAEIRDIDSIAKEITAELDFDGDTKSGEETEGLAPITGEDGEIIEISKGAEREDQNGDSADDSGLEVEPNVSLTTDNIIAPESDQIH